MHPFFDRTPQEVASDLVGKVLRIGEQIAVIREVLPQDEKDNQRWLQKPLFRENPVDIYVRWYRGRHALLFFRTGVRNTCVRVDGIALKGEVVSGPGRVCKALGLASERTGDLSFDGTVLTVTWHDA